MAQFQQTLLVTHPEADSLPELYGPPEPRRHAGQIRRAFESHLVLDHLNLAEALAARFQGRGRDREDLNQVAYLGLVKAAQGFDAGRGTSFAAYAAPTITGELKRHLRDRCWMIRPPRRIQDLRTEVLRSEQALTQTLGHPPTAGELASELDVPASEVREAMAAAASMRPESLDAVETDTCEPRRHGFPFANAAALQDNPLERLEELICLNQAIRVLSTEDQELLYRRYFCEESQAELGRRFGVSQMQISRHLSRVLVRLQALLQDGAAAEQRTETSPSTRPAATRSAQPKRTAARSRT